MHVRATSRATPSFCDGGEGEAQFPHGTWTHGEAPLTLRGIRSARSGLGQRSFRSFLCPTPKVTPRSSLGDVGQARWPLSHRWTDTSSTLPDAAHDSRNQGRVVSLSELSLLSACVRLCQLREVHHSLQQSLNPWSRTQSAATDASPACCTSSLMLRVCVMLRELPSQSSVRSSLVLLLYKQRCLSCLARPVWGTIGRCRGVLPRTNARCVVGQ